MVLYRHGRVLKKSPQIELMFYNDLNFRISDSMSDFILIHCIEFSIKSYIFHILFQAKFFSEMIL